MRKSSPLAKRLLIYVLLCSSIFTLLATGVQLYLDLRSDIQAIEKLMDQIEKSYLKSISISLWNLQEQQLVSQMEGIRNLPDIEFLEIKGDDGKIYKSVGVVPLADSITRQMSLIYFDKRGQENYLGKLTIVASLQNAYNQLVDKIAVILVTQGIKTFLVSFFILFIVQQLITRHLKSMADFVNHLKLQQLSAPFTLSRKTSAQSAGDELSEVAEALNSMRERIQQNIEEEKEKTRLQIQLRETEIREEAQLRYQKEIETSNKDLVQINQNLKKTQAQLVESEKMAALGGLVAGLAHEVNNPLGIAVTGTTFLQDGFKKVENQFKNEELSADIFAKFLQKGLDTSKIIYENLHRAAELISSFKQVAVDQTHFDRSLFNIKDYLLMVLDSLSPKLKRTKPEIKINGGSAIYINSYPGAFAQILTNLIDNSLLHAFQDGEKNKITIDLEREEELLVITFADNGRGIDLKKINKVFEPFYTTKRGKGGTGLGLHILHNLVTQKLKGSIHCSSTVGKGTRFVIKCPLSINT